MPYTWQVILGKIYRQEHKDEIKQKRLKHYDDNKYDVLRKKILYNINTNKTKPRADTINKYNLKFESDKWV